jgi:predicted regulator of Ras-like GTPase activity (Roadblock/LC7/MglB family)
MNRETYANALKSALTEINKAYPDILHSFLFTNNQQIITGDPETNQQTIDNVLESFHNIKEKAKAIGDNLKSLSINSKKGKITLTSINDLHLVMVTSLKVDETRIHTITNVILPIILKTMETITTPTTNLQHPLPSKELIVDTLGGFFAGDSVQIDVDTLMDMTENNDPRARIKAAITGEQTPQKNIDQVIIETFDGNSTNCKVKEIDDQKLKGKNMIRIPEKVCNSLEIKKGDLVKVKPI